MDRMTIRTDKRAIPIIKSAFTGKLLIFALATLQLTGCAKDDRHNTPHPDRGAVRITTDWSGRSSDASVPGSHTLRIGAESQEVTAETNTFKSLLAPGSYRLLAYNTPEGVSITGNTATVDTKDDGTLTPQPGYLFSAGKELDVAADDTLKVTLPMQQYIRSLTLTLELAEGDKERISGTTATLTGIAHSLDLTTGEQNVGQTGRTIAPEFKLSTVTPTRAEGKPALAALLRLMGVITGERQTLTLTVSLKDGSVQTLVTDLTDLLKGFGGTMEALRLDALLNLPTEGDMGGTITGWKEVDNGDITIH
ncbi:FimB/Mfa2 family fimbrial subunit [Phocaeicola sartorii]|uniref:FimB/Mfa2 family fimbrial subunit n=2 Tax=Phocaeicola sartorii TaxID=671267 RepID=UPI00242E522B|nr:FimB/Mfa2 family fimbrial subunit [Phocaeicola sartorii]